MLKPANIRYLLTVILYFCITQVYAQGNFSLRIIAVDKDSIFIHKVLQPQKQFIGKEDCYAYIEQIVPTLQAKGYISASIDTLYEDTTAATIELYTGEIYKWVAVTADSASQRWLSHIGWHADKFAQQIYNPDQLAEIQHRMLQYFENNGYPFSKIYMDSLHISGNEVSGRINVHSGPIYYIDSIRVSGNAKISNDYLHQFLDIKRGSIYSKRKLQAISNQLKKLNYIEEKFPSQIIWGSTGCTIEVFIDQKKSSQVNLIIGFIPNSNPNTPSKLLITGEGLLNLKNAFGGGEIIGLLWQRLQVASQQLRFNYQQPYLFKSPFGVDIGFNMQKRDSTFLNLDGKLGVQLALNTQQQAQLYVQRFSSFLSIVDTARVIALKRLPDEGDVRLTNIGIEYRLNNTNYIFNPVRGFDIIFNTSVGNKVLKRNDEILSLKDPANPDFDFASLYDTVKTKSYQLRSTLSVAKYFPLGKGRSTIKTAINGGYIAGSQIFRNELFQIGGYHLLRGFDEQSQFLSQYGIGTLEYRYLVGENSYFNVFTEGGWGKDDSRGKAKSLSYSYIAGGMGLLFETKVGLFTLTWATGKRNDTSFNLRQSKIHFGFINYF